MAGRSAGRGSSGSRSSRSRRSSCSRSSSRRSSRRPNEERSRRPNTVPLSKLHALIQILIRNSTGRRERSTRPNRSTPTTIPTTIPPYRRRIHNQRPRRRPKSGQQLHARQFPRLRPLTLVIRQPLLRTPTLFRRIVRTSFVEPRVPQPVLGVLIRNPPQQALEQHLRAHAARELLILEQVRQLRAGGQTQEPGLQVGGAQDVASGVLGVGDRDAVVDGAEEGGVDGGVRVEGVAEAVEGAACAWCGEVRADCGFDGGFVRAGGSSGG
jgi:hypothetical protein